MRLQTRYSLYTVAILLLAVLVLTFALVLQNQQSLNQIFDASAQLVTAELKDQVKAKAEAIVRPLAENLAKPLSQFDMEAIKRLLARTNTQPGVLSVTVFDHNGKIIHDGLDDSVLTGKDLTDKTILQDMLDPQGFYVGVSDAWLDATVPIWIDYELLGGVTLRTSLDGVLVQSQDVRSSMGVLGEQILKDVLWLVILVTIPLCVVSGFLALMVVRRLVNPIDQLARRFAQVGRGNLGVQVSWDREDELGNLAHEFNRMSTDLKVAHKELNDAIEVAKQANEAKSVFLAKMSHEIRTPMNGIFGMSDLLLSGNLDVKQSKYANTIQRSAKALLKIIDEILDFSKIESGHFELEYLDFDLYQLIEESIELLSEFAQSKGLDYNFKIRSDVPQWVNGDPSRLRQILLNLISNAVKFTSYGEIRVRVNLDAIDEGYAKIHFSVSDTGVGIAKEARSKVMQPFRQADETITRNYGGTGLGLPISKQLAEMMGGDISIHSIVGQGSMFSLLLPLKVISIPDYVKQNQTGGLSAAEQGQAELDGSAPKCILLAEDNPVNLAVAEGMLEVLGYAYDSVTNGLDAAEACEQCHFDLVLMDCQMPRMDGFEATRVIREYEQRQQRAPIPIVALTANAIKGDRERCLAAGMNDYLGKPFTRQGLEEMLAKWLHQRTASNTKTGMAMQKSILDAEALQRLRELEEDGEKGFVSDIVERYLQHTPERLALMRDALNGAELDDIALEAHSLKSSSALLGAMDVYESCKAIERLAKNKQLSEVAEQVAKLESIYPSIRKELEAYRAGL